MYTSREECMYYVLHCNFISLRMPKKNCICFTEQDLRHSISSAILVYVSEVSFTVAGYLFVSACFFVSNELITYFTVNVVMV